MDKGYFHPLAVVKNVAVNTGVQASIWAPIYFSGIDLEVNFAQSYGNSMFNFLRDCQTAVFVINGYLFIYIEFLLNYSWFIILCYF